MQRRKRLLLVALVGLWFGMLTEDAVVARSSHVCEELCGGVTCESECWLTQFEYDNEYPSTTCAAEGFPCCGDDVCSAGNEGCGVCVDDCGDETCPSTPECYDHDDCDYGYVCNAARECVLSGPYVDGPTTPACGGACTKNSDCCGNEVCLGYPGLQFCGIKAKSYCQNSFSCQDHDDCADHGEDMCPGGTPLDSFCDPGIGRCQFNEQAMCPEDGPFDKNWCQ